MPIEPQDLCRRLLLSGLPGYQALEQIHESAHSIAFRARKLDDSAAVVLKLLKGDFPPPQEFLKYRREYEIGQELLGRPGIARVLGLERMDNTLVLVVEDFGGESLRALLKRQRIPLLEALQIAIKTTDSLREIHAARIIHKDINPANIVYNRDSGELKIVDFGICTKLMRETTEFKPAGVMEGTLLYISPEQTGRVNHAIDFRTDFYSLGVTLYQLFTGEPPFEESDSMRLIHRHLFEMPTPLDEVDPLVPAAVSSIVLKLMKKIPEQRYQSTLGLRADLEKCLLQLQTQGFVDPFTPGEKDYSERLQIPQKLYGREREIDTLFQGLEQVRKGERVFTLLSGYSGIGKTVLVRQILRPLTAAGGTFISGKYEQLRQGNPYSALVDAFNQLNLHLQSGSEETVARYRQQLATALGANGQVILDLLPEFAWLLGPQPPVVDLPPWERLNRFNLMFEKFVAVFARKDHPLVLFLDDLQWADSESLKALKLLGSAPGLESLYLLGAYRDSEVNPDHLLLQTLRELQQSRCQVRPIALAPLDLSQTKQFLAETLRVDPEETEALAELLKRQSDGNPFLLTELIEALFQAGLLTLDRRTGQWAWDLERIQTKGITDNAAALMVRKITLLDESVRLTLQVAACLGNRFELETLSKVSMQDESEVSKHLEVARDAGILLVQSGARSHWSPTAPSNADGGVIYQFVHDKVQQAVRSTIPEEEQRELHYRIGQTLLQTSQGLVPEEKTFEIADHWNICPDLLATGEEAIQLAEVNLLAGKKAKDAAAYQSALSYLQQGIRLHREEWWTSHRELSIELHLEAAEAAYLNGFHQEMEASLEAVMAHSQALEGRLRAAHIRIRSYASSARPADVIRVTRAELQEMNIHFPSKVRPVHVLWGLFRTSLLLRRIGFARLEQLPAMQRPDHLAAMRLLADMGASAYLEDRNLWAMVIIKGMLSIKHGISKYSSVAYAAYGCMLCGVLGDIETGYRFGRLALQVLDRFKERWLAGYVHFVVGNFIAHWKEPIARTLGYYQESHRYSLENGDLFFVSFSGCNYCYTAYFAGMELSVLEKRLGEYRGELLRINNEQAISTLNLYHQQVSNLSQPSDHPTRLSGEWYDESRMLNQHRQRGHRVVLFNVNLLKLILQLLFREYSQAEHCAREARANLEAVTATHSFAVFYFYEALLKLALCAQRSPWVRKRLLMGVASNLRKLRQWAKNAPENHEHKVCLVEAERDRVLERWDSAAQSYERAISLARQHGLTNEQALACELAGEFCLARDKVALAGSYLEQAHHAYLLWGATTKVRHLEQRHRLFFASDT